MGFLSERVMVVRVKGETTAPKSLPGGGPQETLLGLLLFLVLLNFCGYESQLNIGETITNGKKKFNSATFHSKYVDNLTIAEALNIKDYPTQADHYRIVIMLDWDRNWHPTSPKYISNLTKSRITLESMK